MTIDNAKNMIRCMKDVLKITISYNIGKDVISIILALYYLLTLYQDPSKVLQMINDQDEDKYAQDVFNIIESKETKKWN